MWLLIHAGIKVKSTLVKGAIAGHISQPPAHIQYKANLTALIQSVVK